MPMKSVKYRPFQSNGIGLKWSIGTDQDLGIGTSVASSQFDHAFYTADIYTKSFNVIFV